MGYEEATKLFRRIDDEKSSEYNKYAGMMKKFVVEANAMAQEKALEAILAFVECAAVAGRYTYIYYMSYTCSWKVHVYYMSCSWKVHYVMDMWDSCTTVQSKESRMYMVQ